MAQDTSDDIRQLLKPDMVAVLKRTHLAHDRHGMLLPVLEAVTNAMDGIEFRFQDESAARDHGAITVHFKNAANPHSLIVTVTDNGVGLTDSNFRSFRTPFSGMKLDKKGRGFGRFIAFKVFTNIVYRSRYETVAEAGTRCFRFDIHSAKELNFDGVAEPSFKGPGMQVEMSSPHAAWSDLIRELTSQDVREEIASHFLPYFLNRWLPKITVQFDDGEELDIRATFQSVFKPFASDTFECVIDEVKEMLHYTLARVPLRGSKFKSHSLLFSAADRIVGAPRDLGTKLGEDHFTDAEGNKYVILAVVKGDAFENRLNDARTGINISPKVIEDIVGKLADAIQKVEKGQIDRIKTDQSRNLGEALKRNPILRLGLKGRTLEAYVAGKPNSWRPENFVADLALERFRASSDLSNQISAAAANPENYDSTLKALAEKLDEGNKAALAEYVLHRKNIITLMEAAQRYQEGDKRAPEDRVHELVFRRFSDNSKTGYFEHNLWLIDDLLSFAPYIASDRTMHGKGRKSGDKVGDLTFYDDSMILGDSDGTTLAIVEFKRPSRDDYRIGAASHDPVIQVIETLEKATAAGGMSKADGTHITFRNIVRRFAYIIADHTTSLVKLLKYHDFKNDWNPNIFVRYRDNERILIQVFGYETLVEMAKKRNQAFFSVLFGE